MNMYFHRSPTFTANWCQLPYSRKDCISEDECSLLHEERPELRAFARLPTHQQAVFFAIGIMSLEEGVLRSTFAVRELWYRRFRNQPPASDAELARLKVGWAVQIANSMHCEIFAIFLCKLLVIAAR